MTTTLPHPPAEDLGRFVEGTLDDAGRTAVVAHIADCDECRIMVVDTAGFVEPAAESHWYRWVGIAAVVVLLVGMGTLTNPEYRNKAIGWLLSQFNPLAGIQESYDELKSRPIEARLSGFSYKAKRRVTRGEAESDPAETQLEAAAYDVLERRGDDPAMQHAKGIARLFAAQGKLARMSTDSAAGMQKDLLEAEHVDSKKEQDYAVALLQSAAIRVPANAHYQNDLAVALIATHDRPNLTRAVNACERALQIDHNSREALFNRALALQELSDRDKAMAAFKLYLNVDSSSPWADEARTNLNSLQEGA